MFKNHRDHHLTLSICIKIIQNKRHQSYKDYAMGIQFCCRALLTESETNKIYLSITLFISQYSAANIFYKM